MVSEFEWLPPQGAGRRGPVEGGAAEILGPALSGRLHCEKRCIARPEAILPGTNSCPSRRRASSEAVVYAALCPDLPAPDQSDCKIL